MFKVTVTSNFKKGLQDSLKKIIEKQANEILNKKVAHLASEIRKEPLGRFSAKMENGNSLVITHSGFSPELSAKLNEAFR